MRPDNDRLAAVVFVQLGIPAETVETVYNLTKRKSGYTVEEYEEIKVVGQDVKLEGSTLLLESTLNRRPDREWIPLMEHASVGKAGGSATFAFSIPRVSGDKVRIPIEDRDVEAAVSFIAASVSYANQRFESQVLVSRQRQAALKQEQEAAQTAQLEQARERLRKVTNSTSE